MTSMAKSGGPSLASPSFYFKQLYNRAVEWTVARVAVLLGYRDEKVEEILGSIPAGIDTINTKALERHLFSHPHLFG